MNTEPIGFKGMPGDWECHYDDNGFYYADCTGRHSPYLFATGSEGPVNEANIQMATASKKMAVALQNARKAMCVHLNARFGDDYPMDHYSIVEIDEVLKEAGLNP